jgi:hypothetical protein
MFSVGTTYTFMSVTSGMFSVGTTAFSNN